jgi:hypothetical protein
MKQNNRRIIICLIIVLVLSTGCLEPYKEQMDEATSLIESGSSRFSTLTSQDWSTVYVGSIRSAAAGARSDYSEAKKILDKIPSNAFSGQDQSDFNAAKIVVNIAIEFCDLYAGALSDYIESAQQIVQTSDPQIVANKVTTMKNSLQTIKASLSRMNEELGTIREYELSPKMKGEIISLKTLIQSLQNDVDKAIYTLNTACIKKCYAGYILGSDCQCHPQCGNNYCSSDAVCCGGQCYTSCPYGQIMGSDCYCHLKCGNNYCSSDAVCCGGQCYTQCPYGSYMGNDCYCHSYYY